MQVDAVTSGAARYLPAIAPIVMLLAICSVAPTLLTDPRFWAEEGSLYYPNAMALGAGSLLSVINGNYQFLANLFVWASTFVDPLYAPAVTTYASLAVMGVVAAQVGLVIRDQGQAPWIAVLVILAWVLSPMSWEITASATNIQWVAALSMLLLSVQDLSRLRGATLAGVLIWVAMCGLSGVPSAVLAPVLLLAAWLNRSKVHTLIGGLLAACALVQVGIVASHPISGRLLSVGLRTTLLPPAMHAFYGPFLGIGEAKLIGERAEDSVALTTLLIAGAGAMMALISVFSQRPKIIWVLIIAIVLTGIVQSIGSLGDMEVKIANIIPPSGARYYATASMAALMAIALCSPKPTIPALLLAIIVANGVPQTLEQWEYETTMFPAWGPQASQCSGECRIEIWPPGWFVEINRP